MSCRHLGGDSQVRLTRLSLVHGSLVLLFVLCTAGCGGTHVRSSPEPASTPTQAQTRPPSEGAEDTPYASTRDDGRGLAITATYAHLVDRVRALDAQARDAGVTGSTTGPQARGCILRGGFAGASARLEAELAAAIHPLPRAAPNFAQRLRDARGITTLTRWGSRGDGDLAIVALTATPPPGDGEMVVVLVGSEGVWLRRTGSESLSTEMRGPFPRDRLRDNLASASVGAAGVLVTLEAGLPIAALRRTLENVPASAPPLALGVLLEAGTRLPNTTPPSQSQGGMCTVEPLDALPSAASFGTLTASEIRQAFAPMGESARRCFSVASGPAARGGRISVRFRIGPSGRVNDECATRDEMGDAALRVCILHAIHGLVFPRPRDGDYVEVAVPVALSPDDSLRQAPLCDP